MHILLTNDDGILAPGLAAMYRQLMDLGEVTVVAPSDSQSGTSHSITFAEPIVCNKIDVNGQFKGYAVQGSPADCVKLAYLQLSDEPIDLVVSGINNGANVGINIYYSGTVAAAMEAAFLHIPAVACSLAWEEDMQFEKAAEYFAKIIDKLLPMKKAEVINVNVPRLSGGEPAGMRVVPQSTKGFHEYYVAEKDKHGQTVFQLAGGVHRQEQEPTDTMSLVEGFITLTALAQGMTDKARTEELKMIKW